MVGTESADACQAVQSSRWWLSVKKTQQSLKSWTDQKWRTSDGSKSNGKKRYLPDAAWNSLTPAEKRATNAAKAKGNRAGKQHVAQPKKVAKKTAKFRSK